MKRFLKCVASGVVVMGFIGCGESTVTEGPVPYKPTDTKQFDQMKAEMLGRVKGPAPKKPAADKAADAPAEKPADAEKKD